MACIHHQNPLRIVFGIAVHKDHVRARKSVRKHVLESNHAV
jgi:hypothetical protein